MFGRPKFRQLLGAGCMVALFTVAATAQTSLPLSVQAIPVGQKPLGVDLLTTETSSSGEPVTVVVSNSGEDSVSLFRGTSTSQYFGYRLEFLRTVPGIPAPYGVASCTESRSGGFGRGDRVLVTSPTENSVSVIRVTDGSV